MANTKLNFNEIIINPIEGFYNKIENNIEALIDDYFKKNNNDNFNSQLINKLDNKIDEFHNEIDDKYKLMNISGLKATNVFILIFCFLIIGLFFLSIYFKNKKIINEFYQFANEHYNKISLLEEKKRNEIMSTFSNLNLFKICNYIYDQFGIKTSNYIDVDLEEIERGINLDEGEEIIDVYSGIQGVVKNSIFWDLIIRTHCYSDVVTSKSKSFPYVVYVPDGNGGTRMETRYETLTAYHHEDTPFIVGKNIVMYKTNYNTELLIKNNGSVSSKKSIFENKDFVKKVRINDYSDNPQKLMECFTIKTQEEFVKWYDHEKNNVFDFVKIDDNFFIINETEDNDVLDYLNSPTDENDISNSVLYSDVCNIENIKQNIKTAVTQHFIRWAKMVQLPLLIPGISREWYTRNKKYLIAQSKDLQPIEIDKIEQIEPLSILNNLLFDKYIWFNDEETNNSLKRPMWFSFDEYSEGKGGSYLCMLNLHSYYSQTHYDNVIVHGFNVGAQTISVPFERFYPVSEPKLLIFIQNKNNSSKNKFVVSFKLNELISPNHYTDKDFYERISNLNIWAENTNDFENCLDKEKLLMNFERFQQLNLEHDLGAMIKMDEFGVQILINKCDVDESILTKLVDIACKLNLINY